MKMGVTDGCSDDFVILLFFVGRFYDVVLRHFRISSFDDLNVTGMSCCQKDTDGKRIPGDL
jgi:hypothetical protein